MKKLIMSSVLAVGVVVGAVFFLTSQSPNDMLASLVKNERFVTLKTNYGDIKIELEREKVPNLTKNFLSLARSGKYNNTIFHRVIPGFMIQGGDYENFNGTGGTSYTGNYLKDEFGEGLSNIRGVISMANKGPNTNGSQFFLVQKNSEFLDGRHSVFGKIIKGMETVDEIASVKTDDGDRPLDDVKIKSVIIE